MLVHKHKKPTYQIQMPLTSLIDIVFMLLIYFLLTTSFMVDEGIKINLPQAKASQPQTTEEIVIYVDKEGKTFIAEKQIPQDVLFNRLKEMIGNDKDRLVIVKSDRTVILNKVVKVMDLAKAAGAARLCLATEKGF
ncbi:MAG: biopolymer transporter ExbD [Proteobacteria bacterium]|nr:biopolymer transporter ExbD [Pseudomonadota bacterium]